MYYVYICEISFPFFLGHCILLDLSLKSCVSFFHQLVHKFSDFLRELNSLQIKKEKKNCCQGHPNIATSYLLWFHFHMFEIISIFIVFTLNDQSILMKFGYWLC